MRREGDEALGEEGPTRPERVAESGEAAGELAWAQEQLLAPGADALDAAVDAVLEQAARALGAERAGVLLFTPGGQVTVDRLWTTPGTAHPSVPGPHLPWVVARLRAGAPVAFAHVGALPAEAAEDREFLVAHGVRSGLLVPLASARDGVIGWASFVTLTRGRDWHVPQLRLAARYGVLLAAALLRLRAERERDEQHQALAAVAQVSAVFLRLPPERVGEGVREALRILSDHLGAARAIAWTQEEGTSEVRRLATWPATDLRVPARGTLEQLGVAPLLHEHLARNEPWCLPSLEALPPGSEGGRAQLTAVGVRALVAMPLRAGERRVGWLTFSRPEPSRWTDTVVRRIQPVADLVGAALLRARDAERVRSLAGQLLEAHDVERARLASLLHDGPAQQLFAAVLGLARLRVALTEPGPASAVAECEVLCREALQQLRTLAYLLPPPMLAQSGLTAALRWYLEGFTARAGVEAELLADGLEEGEEGRLSPELEHALFRVVQEALSNVQRHSGSPSVQVRVERAGGWLTVSVCDRGRGFRAGGDAAPRGLGLASMRERLRQVEGTLHVQSGPEGTVVRATVPLDMRALEGREDAP